MKVADLHFPSHKIPLLLHHATRSIPHLLLFTILLLLAASLLLLSHQLQSPLQSIPTTIPNLPPSLPPTLHLQSPGSGIHSTVRHLHPIGLAAYAFVLTGAYRTSPSSFAILGLASKPFHVFAKPHFACHWLPPVSDPVSGPVSGSISGSSSEVSGSNPASSPIFGRVRKLLPDWGYGRIYTVVIIHCTFPSPVGEDRSGGELHLHVGGIEPSTVSNVTALIEQPGEFNPATFSPPYKYDYLYCGSSLYGDVNPERLREWLAYHAMLFGPRSHFVFHDAGGMASPGMSRVLEPWIRLGYVTVHDFREEERFDGYYHNQFLLVNDCLFRYKFAANWTFFFDVDEYVYVSPPETLESVLGELGRNYSQIMFEQYRMSRNMCVEAAGATVDSSRQWGFEKMVFRNMKTAIRLDRKYVVRAAMADSAGVHLSEHVRGENLYSRGKMHYYHFHNTITDRGDSCMEYLKPPSNKTNKIWVGKTPYVYDDSLSSLAPAAKMYERQLIGS